MGEINNGQLLIESARRSLRLRALKLELGRIFALDESERWCPCEGLNSFWRGAAPEALFPIHGTYGFAIGSGPVIEVEDAKLLIGTTLKLQPYAYLSASANNALLASYREGTWTYDRATLDVPTQQGEALLLGPRWLFSDLLDAPCLAVAPGPRLRPSALAELLPPASLPRSLRERQSEGSQKSSTYQ